MMLLALSSAVPTISASFWILLFTATLQVTGTAISSATTTATIATIIVVVTGAPPYLVFIVQIQQYKFIFFSYLCQVFQDNCLNIFPIFNYYSFCSQ